MKQFIIASVIVNYENKLGNKLEIKLEDSDMVISITKAEDWHSALCKAFGHGWNWPSSSIQDAEKYGREKCCTLIKIEEIESDLWCSPVGERE